MRTIELKSLDPIAWFITDFFQEVELFLVDTEDFFVIFSRDSSIFLQCGTGGYELH